MTQSKANWHAVAALSMVIIAECSGLKDETTTQLGQHGPFFWICLIFAIAGSYANSVISTKPTSENPPAQPQPAPDNPPKP